MNEETPQSQEPFNNQLPPIQPISSPEPIKTKSKIRILLVLLIAILLIAGAITAWVFFGRSTESDPASVEQQSTETQVVDTFKPEVFVQNDRKIQFIGQDGNLQDFALLEENERLEEVIENNGEIKAMYTTSFKKENGEIALGDYGEITSSGKNKILTFPSNSDYYYSYPKLSPDKKSIIIETSDIAGFMVNLTRFDVATGDSEVVYEPTTPELGLRQVVGWVDNNTVYLQKQTCRQCDGPSLAVLSKLSFATKSETAFFNPDDSIETLTYAGFQQSYDRKKLYVIGGDYSVGFGLEPGVEHGPSQIYEIDLVTAGHRLVSEFDEYFVNFPGLSNDGSVTIVSIADWQKTDDPNSVYQSVDGNYEQTVPLLKRLITADGTLSAIPIESRHIVAGTYINQVVENSGSVLMVTQQQKYENGSFVGIDQALLQLKEGSTEIKTILEQSFSDTNDAILIYKVMR